MSGGINGTSNQQAEPVNPIMQMLQGGMNPYQQMFMNRLNNPIMPSFPTMMNPVNVRSMPSKLQQPSGSAGGLLGGVLAGEQNNSLFAQMIRDAINGSMK